MLAGGPVASAGRLLPTRKAVGQVRGGRRGAANRLQRRVTIGAQDCSGVAAWSQLAPASGDTACYEKRRRGDYAHRDFHECFVALLSACTKLSPSLMDLGATTAAMTPLLLEYSALPTHPPGHPIVLVICLLRFKLGLN
jgi:hypothetical protein